MRPPPRPMRPTSPASLVHAEQKPAAPTVDWKTLALDLARTVEKRRPLASDLNEAVAAVLAAAGLEPTVRAKQDVPPRPIGRALPPAPVEIDTVEDEPADEDLTIGSAAVSPTVGADLDDDDDGFVPYDPFAVDQVPGRGIDPNDPWLKPFDGPEAARRAADDAVLGAANQARLEAEHARLIAAGKMRPRPPMRRS